ncbi:MAG: DUF2079 domain-containing protein [Thermoleophilia bacterium]
MPFPRHCWAVFGSATRTPALACGIVYLMYPAIQWSLVTEFHPVTLATPLLLWCIWAVDTDRMWVLMVLAPLAALTKEQVGVALAMIGVWALVRRSRRRVGSGADRRWPHVVAGLLPFIIPHSLPVGESLFVELRGTRGIAGSGAQDGGHPRPREALAIMVDGGRPGYLAAMLLPLLLAALRRSWRSAHCRSWGSTCSPSTGRSTRFSTSTRP